MQLSTRRDLLEEASNIGDLKKYNMMLQNISLSSNVKNYLTESVETRANRRYLELKEKGIESNYEEIKKDIEERDYRDKNREFAPLLQAEDAVLLDTSDMTVEEVINSILTIKEKAK